MANDVTKLDSYKPFSPQNIVDLLQREVDEGAEDIIIICSKGDWVRFMTTAMSDRECIGMLEQTKMNL